MMPFDHCHQHSSNALQELIMPHLTDALVWQVIEYVLQKLTLVGLLVFVDRGSLEQLIVGLIVCFIYFGLCSYLVGASTTPLPSHAIVPSPSPGIRVPPMALTPLHSNPTVGNRWQVPFASHADNVLVCVTQFSLFISLLTAIILEHGPPIVSPTVVQILTVASITPAILAILFSVQVCFNELGIDPVGRLARLVWRVLVPPTRTGRTKLTLDNAGAARTSVTV